ncbi:hypothetical protein ACM17_23840 [Escherichia coli]|nr:hypothetical protein VK74_24600 [Escherichia coli]APK96844.1 hypothetical protein RG54_24965 [Escherichia coli]APL01703.1 hypothetical protein RG55_24945 [Escherichia coli]KMV40776.1 hypothetical protein ACM17_23840 [Escherichia coli]
MKETWKLLNITLILPVSQNMFLHECIYLVSLLLRGSRIFMIIDCLFTERLRDIQGGSPSYQQPALNIKDIETYWDEVGSLD